MSRQINVSRVELSLSNLQLNDPQNGLYVSDEWSEGGILYQRYEAATSPFADGETVVAQRKQNTDQVFTIYINATSNADYQNKINEVKAAFGQYRYDITIEWDGNIYSYEAAGAADIARSGNVDPILHKANWHAFQITVPTKPL